MRKSLLTLTIVILAFAAAVLAVVGLTAPRTSATPSLCHSTVLSIKAPASTTSGSTIKVTGAEAQKPAHTVKATLQFRKATATAWINGASANLSSSGTYSLKWKAPAKAGKYKLRVRVTHSGASNKSAVKTVTVK